MIPNNKSYQIPGYEIKKVLGKGGMGIVYLAVQTALDRQVALKVTLPALAELDPSFTTRFVKEAKATAALNHPNIVTIYDAGEHNNSSYMSMEYIPSGTFADLDKSNLSQNDICNLFIGISLGLGAAHKAGFIHRDVKPDNILIDEKGIPLVTDFGVVKTVRSETPITKAGSTLGTPQYMSPEQIQAEKVDGRSDLYSVGIMLFNLLEGHVPFEDETPSAVYVKHVTIAPPPLSRTNCVFQSIITKLLKKNPNHRFNSAEELADALKELIIDDTTNVEPDEIELPKKEDVTLANVDTFFGSETNIPEHHLQLVKKNKTLKLFTFVFIFILIGFGVFFYNEYYQNQPAKHDLIKKEKKSDD